MVVVYLSCLVCLSQCKTRQNHQRQPESECQPDDVAEPLERPCQPELESQSAGAAGAAEPEYDVAEPLQWPRQPELESQSFRTAGAAEPEYDAAEPLGRPGK